MRDISIKDHTGVRRLNEKQKQTNKNYNVIKNVIITGSRYCP